MTLKVTAANEQERAQVGKLVEAVQKMTGNTIEIAFVDEGYTATEPIEAAAAHGVRLEVIKLPEAKRRFVLLPRRWGSSVLCPGGSHSPPSSYLPASSLLMLPHFFPKCALRALASALVPKIDAVRRAIKLASAARRWPL